MKISSSLKNKQLLKKLSIRTGSYFVPIPNFKNIGFAQAKWHRQVDSKFK